MPTATRHAPLAATAVLRGPRHERPGMPTTGPRGRTDGVLHGRDAECAAVRRLLDDARGHGSGVLVVHGEPGVGKTALLDHAVTHAADMTVLQVTGVEAELDLAHAGMHQLVNPVVDRVRELPEPQARALRTALGVDQGRHDPFMVSVALLSLVAVVAGDGPLLVVVDDVQWLDRASASALAFVARRLHAESVALLFATRPPDDGRAGGAALDLPRLQLGGLSSEAAATMLDGHLPGETPLHVRQRLLALADGNPLALQELPRALSPAQLSGYAVLPDPVPVSSTIENAFLHRVDGLSPAAGTLLLVAASERYGDVDLVLHAGSAVGCGTEALTEAEAAGLLTVAGNRLRFRHPLVRSAVYRSASRVQRQVAHAALADGLDPVVDCDRRAWHRALATVGQDRDVADELERSADRALRRSGHATASTILELAADLSPRSADVVRRLVAAATAAWAAGQVERVRILLDRAAPLTNDVTVNADIEMLRAQRERAVGTTGRAHDTLMAAAQRVAATDRRRALTLATAAGTAAWGRNDSAQLVAAADRVVAFTTDDATPDGVNALALRAFAGAFQGELTTAAGCTTRAIDTAERLGGAHELAMAGTAALCLGDDTASLRVLGHAAARARTDGTVAILVNMLAAYAAAEAWTSRVRSARAHATEGLTLAQQTGHRTYRSLYEAVLAWISAVTGDHDECERLALQAGRRGLEQEFAPAVAIAGWARGLGALGAGRPDEAHGHLGELVRRDVRASHPMVAVAATGDIVEAAVMAGDPDTAQTAMAALEQLAAATGRPWACAVAARSRALTCTTGGVEEHFMAALGHHAGGSRPFEHGRTLLAYGGWLRRRRRRIDARHHLRVALQIFERVGATDWADRAHRELRASGETVRRASPAGIATLTPQEVQVVQFVRTGATNKQIAAQLYLSPRTIDYHLRKVFVKLGFSSRAELIALAADDLGHASI